jgi:hypothetical protein
MDRAGDREDPTLEVRTSILLPWPLTEVFPVAAHPSQQTHWDPDLQGDLETVTPGEVGAWARYRGRFRGWGTLEYEYAVFDPPQQFTLHFQTPWGAVEHEFQFTALPEGTQLEQVARLISNWRGRAAEPLLRRRLEGRLRGVGEGLQAYLARSLTNPDRTS